MYSAAISRCDIVAGSNKIQFYCFIIFFEVMKIEEAQKIGSNAFYCKNFSLKRIFIGENSDGGESIGFYGIFRIGCGFMGKGVI